MKAALWTSLFLLLTYADSAFGDSKPAAGVASWYGEEHRGRLMANGKRFNPDKLTAASWFYPLGTKVRVILNSTAQNPRSVLVTITDRGPAKDLVRDGRIIDLTRAAFKRLGHPAVGLVGVRVEPLD
jgi:rare lipoprotein A